MKIQITIDLGDVEREAIAYSHGLEHKPDYQDCKDWLYGAIRGDLEAVVNDYLASDDDADD